MTTICRTIQKEVKRDEREAVELLERVANAVEVGPPPIGRIAADGRRRERARRRW